MAALTLALSLGVQNTGSSAWTPASLGASLLGWWDAEASSTLTLSGASVTSWADKVGGYALAQATGAKQPQYSASSFNSRPGVTFDGSDDEMTMLSVPFPSGATPCEVWGLVSQDALAANATTRYLFSYGGTANLTQRRVERIQGAGPVNRAQALSGNGSTTNTKSDAIVDLSGLHIIRGTFDGTVMNIIVDGNANSSTGAIPATGTTQTRLGAASSDPAAGFWQGQVNTLIVTGTLSATQATALTAYLAARANADATLSGDYPNGTQFTYGQLLKTQNAYDGSNGKLYAFQLSTGQSLERFETREGDEWIGDAGRMPPRARSETTPVSGGLTKGTAYYLAYDLMVEAPGGAGGGVFGQLHKSGTDLVPSSPIISIELNSTGQVRFKSSYSYDDVETNPAAVIVDRTDYSGSTVVYGAWQRIVIKVTHAAVGVDHGSLEVWLNTVKVVDLTDIPLGYLGSGGPYWKRGIYRSGTAQRMIAHYANWNGPTTSSLAALITAPPTLPYVVLAPS